MKKCEHYRPESKYIKAGCHCDGDLPDSPSWKNVRDELEYYKRTTDFLDSLIAGYGGAIDDARLKWYRDNPLPSPPEVKEQEDDDDR